MKRPWSPWLVLLLALVAPRALAIPVVINHEGLLLDEDGLPMEGMVTLRLSLYERSEGGDPLWFEEYQVQLIDGYYMLRLGEQRDLDGVFSGGEPCHLGISVNHGAELQPRHRVVSVPYALVSENTLGDITPNSIWVGGQQVIDEEGSWVGPPVPGAGDGVGYDTPEEVLAALRTVDGADSLIDADLLDGHDSSEFPRGADQVLALLEEVDGIGSGLDADRLDGLDSSQFFSTAQQVRDQLRTVDGSGSGVDADLLDGLDSSQFITTAVQVRDQLRTVDGQGSGVDADRLDGLDSSQLMRADTDTATTGSLQVGGTLSTSDLRLAAGSRLGIGVADPQFPLHVQGTVRASTLRASSLLLDAQDAPPGDPVLGLVYLDTETKRLHIYDGESWLPLSTPPPTDLKRSCSEIIEAGGNPNSGTYTIDPTGGTDEDAFDVYCNMSTDGGGWTLVMKLSKGDFCYGSQNWTLESPFNEAQMLSSQIPNVRQYDAKSRAFYTLADTNQLRFQTSRGQAINVTFTRTATPMNLITTNDVSFAEYPDFNQWQSVFGPGRRQAPIFMRAGVPVTEGNRCRTNPQATPSGCGKRCTFCYQAADGDCCPCNVTANDVNFGIGNNPAYCGGGDAGDCSTSGNWADSSLRTNVWAR